MPTNGMNKFGHIRIKENTFVRTGVGAIESPILKTETNNAKHIITKIEKKVSFRQLNLKNCLAPSVRAMLNLFRVSFWSVWNCLSIDDHYITNTLY